MPKVEIDGRQIEVEEGVNLIQAAERLGIEIPHYCYHPALTVAGNCRMCLVEVEKVPKLQIACNTRVLDGMVVRTATDRVKKAREAVLEFLLINHPIDCPICDQAGECKLQDYYMDYDRQPSRVPLEAKVRKGKALDIGPLVMLDQERCILCTRCTRFLEEVTKTGELGVFERGDHCRIDLFPGRRLDNPYSGNVVDICPVGALTNKEFRFRARVWYLNRTPSICTSCATGCNIDIHHRNGEMFRFRPRFNPDVNRYWMCDEGRMSFSRYQGEGRLLQPVQREARGWAVKKWEDLLESLTSRLRLIVEQHGQASVGGIVSARASNEEAFLFARLIRDQIGGSLAGYSWSPPDADHDDFLIDRDKQPNTAGLRELGIGVDPDAVLAKASEGKLQMLFLFRSDLSAEKGEAFVQKLAQKVKYLVLIDTHFHATAAHARILLPIATFAESAGTYVNRARRVQLARQAFAPPGEAREGWQVIADLSSRVAGTPVPIDPAAVFAEIAAAHPAFRRMSHASLGLAGAALA